MTNENNEQFDEQFDLAPQIEEPLNTFKIVHLYNKSDIYHLTRQVLLDSVLTQNSYCFFYHILAKTTEDFNEMYGSFACLISRNTLEADLYLNVHTDALRHIINYIQTSKIDGQSIYINNWKTIDEIIDLATMFGMPNLVTLMRSLHPSEEQIENKINMINQVIYTLAIIYNRIIDTNFNIDEFMYNYYKLMDENKKEFIDTFIKIIHNNDILNKYLGLFNKIIPVNIPDEKDNFHARVLNPSILKKDYNEILDNIDIYLGINKEININHNDTKYEELLNKYNETLKRNKELIQENIELLKDYEKLAEDYLKLCDNLDGNLDVNMDVNVEGSDKYNLNKNTDENKYTHAQTNDIELILKNNLKELSEDFNNIQNNIKKFSIVELEKWLKNNFNLGIVSPE